MDLAMDDAVFPYQELRQGNFATLRAWLARGGQIDAPLLSTVAETWTPLMLACAEGDVTLVRAIIEAGGARASARVGTKVLASSTPLHVASRYGHAGTAAVLLELGAVVDVRDTIGATPLQYAAGNGHLKTMEVLLDAGAGTSAESPGGATALDMAEMAGFGDAVVLLRKRAVRGEAGAVKRRSLVSWLEALDCEEFLGRFLRAGYDDLPFMASHGLTEADLDCIGVPTEKLGLRKKLLAMHGVEQFLDRAKTEDGRDSGGSSTDEESTATPTNSNSGNRSSSSASDGDTSEVEEETSGSDESSSRSGSDTGSSN